MPRTTSPLSRRDLLRQAAILPVAAYAAGCGPAGAARRTAGPNARFARLERSHHARLAVFGYDTGSGMRVAYRADERFPFCSTYKALAAGLVLRQRPLTHLDSVVHYSREDLVTYSPVTAKHVATGMPLREICAAAIRYSDNTAGNLLFRELGGPAGFEHGLRNLGDRITRSERRETALNTAIPGDPRDTSTARTLAADYRKLLLGNALPPAKRALLKQWLITNTTGDTLIRAGVPKSWTVGDKTGAGEYGSRNDAAILWPPGRSPIVMVILTTRPTPKAPYDDALVADAARMAVEALRTS